ncbi:hypothetical protein M1589_00870 [Candidatus Marsarchaeota archaeon]|nr:hypothetical protein [Candidatus Marsarchaeota archaeon]
MARSTVTHYGRVPSALLRAEVTDPEVHVGKNLFGATSDLEVFKHQIPRFNIVNAIVIPESTYELRLSDGRTERSCLWRVDEATGNVVYTKELMRGEERFEEINPRSPLLNSNKHFLELLKLENKKRAGFMFYFAPVLHPKLDIQWDIEQFLNDDITVGIKMHGISGHYVPKDVPGWVVRLAKRYDVPFIIHTDFIGDPLAGAVEGAAKMMLRRQPISEDMANLRRANRPLKWARWVIDNGVAAYLAHGIRLDSDAARIVNHEESIIVGTGPDYSINSEKERLFIKDRDYLTCLFEMLDPKRIAFSSDFAWNWFDASNMANLDWGMKRRVIAAGMARGLSDDEIRAVLSANSVRFFGL